MPTPPAATALTSTRLASGALGAALASTGAVAILLASSAFASKGVIGLTTLAFVVAVVEMVDVVGGGVALGSFPTVLPASG